MTCPLQGFLKLTIGLLWLSGGDLHCLCPRTGAVSRVLAQQDLFPSEEPSSDGGSSRGHPADASSGRGASRVGEGDVSLPEAEWAAGGRTLISFEPLRTISVWTPSVLVSLSTYDWPYRQRHPFLAECPQNVWTIMASYFPPTHLGPCSSNS